MEGAVNYNEPIPQSDQLDDIGYLQNSFAAMQQALREHMGNETTGKLNGNHIVMSPSIEIIC